MAEPIPAAVHPGQSPQPLGGEKCVRERTLIEAMDDMSARLAAFTSQSGNIYARIGAQMLAIEAHGKLMNEIAAAHAAQTREHIREIRMVTKALLANTRALDQIREVMEKRR